MIGADTQELEKCVKQYEDAMINFCGDEDAAPGEMMLDLVNRDFLQDHWELLDSAQQQRIFTQDQRLRHERKNALIALPIPYTNDKEKAEGRWWWFVDEYSD